MTFFQAPWAGFYHENSWLVVGFTTSFPLRYDTQPFTFPPPSSLCSPLFSYRRRCSSSGPRFSERSLTLGEGQEREREREREREEEGASKGQPSHGGAEERTGQGKLILNVEVGHLVYFFINFPPMDRRVTPHTFLREGCFRRVSRVDCTEKFAGESG